MGVRSVALLAALFTCALTASPAQAAGNDGWRGWILQTTAETLTAFGRGGEPDLQSGGEQVLDRGVSTLRQGLRRAAPNLDRFEVALDLDQRFRPGYGLGLTQPLARGRAFALEARGSFRHDPGGRSVQTIAAHYQSIFREPASAIAPSALAIEVERSDDRETEGAGYALDGRIAWAGFALRGGIRDDEPAEAQSGASRCRIDNAHADVVIGLPLVRRVEFETGRAWSTSQTDPGRLVVSDAHYLVRARPSARSKSPRVGATLAPSSPTGSPDSR